MKLIQLNTLPLPTSPDQDRLFPYLFEDDLSGTLTYRFAFLIARANRMLVGCLRQLGFASLPAGGEIAVPATLGLGTPADWQFIVCGVNGLFRPLTDDTGADPLLRLSRYLTFAGLTNDDVTVPTAITVVESTLSSTAFTPPASWTLKGLSPADGSAWSFHLAVANNTVNDARLAFRIPVEAAGDLSDLGLGFTFEFSGGGGTAEENWDTGTLQARSVPIVGEDGDRLYLGDAAFELRPSAQGFLLNYEADPQKELELPGIRDLRLTLGLEVMYVRFSEEIVAVHSYASTLGTPLTLSLGLEFPLVMAPVSGATPEALSLIVPLLDQVADELFSLKLDVTLGDAWEADQHAIASYDTDRNRWSVSDHLWSEAAKHPIVSEQLHDALALGGFEWSLSDLFGEAFGLVTFQIGPDHYDRGGLTISVDDQHRPKLTLPMLLVLSVGQGTTQFRFTLVFDLRNFRLSSNSLGFRYPPSFSGGGMQVVDLGVLALFLPERVGDSHTQGVDGAFDFEKREFVLKADTGTDPVASQNDNSIPNPILAIPGNLTGDLSQRLLFELNSFSPDTWPTKTTDQIFLRINAEGLSLNAKVMTDHRPNVLRGSEGIRPLGVTPLAEREGRRSEVVLIDNTFARRSSLVTLKFRVLMTWWRMSKSACGRRSGDSRRSSMPRSILIDRMENRLLRCRPAICRCKLMIYALDWSGILAMMRGV